MTTKEEALAIFKSQDKQELDFCYEGGSKDAIFVAKTLARYLLSTDALTFTREELESHKTCAGHCGYKGDSNPAYAYAEGNNDAIDKMLK
jgi:hypothetical protein